MKKKIDWFVIELIVGAILLLAVVDATACEGIAEEIQEAKTMKMESMAIKDFMAVREYSREQNELELEYQECLAEEKFENEVDKFHDVMK